MEKVRPRGSENENLCLNYVSIKLNGPISVDLLKWSSRLAVDNR